MALDDDCKFGFKRPEMFKEKLAGTWKEKTDRYIFLVLGKAAEWPEDIKDLPEGSLLHALKNTLKNAQLKEKVKLGLAEAAEGDAEGDVLIFPGPRRCNIQSGTEALSQILQTLDAAPSADLEDAHVFVCAHTKRDERCGYCGPELVSSFQATKSQTRSIVRKCSHVGGHVYAGNVLVFDANCGAGDFYGYVTPASVSDVLSGKARRGPLWRGALGLTAQEAIQSRRNQIIIQWAPIVFVIGIGACVLWRSRRK